MRPLRAGSYSEEPGTGFGTPKELWGFRIPAAKGRAKSVAVQFLKANAELLGLERGLHTLSDEPRVVASVGAHHVIFRQVRRGLPVHRGYVTVHMDRHNRIYLAKNRAAADTVELPKPEFEITNAAAIDIALDYAETSRRLTTLRRPPCRRTWFFWKDDNAFVPAIRVRFMARKPRKDWTIFVDGQTGEVLSANDNLSHATGKARVFDPNPVAAMGDHELLFSDPSKLGKKNAWRFMRDPIEEAYVEVLLPNLKGNGRLEGKRVTTRPTKRRLHRRSHDFRLPSDHPKFEEPMVYFHIDRAIRYLESLGYSGRRSIFREPVEVNVNGTKEDNAYYSPGENMLVFGTGGVDTGEDGETILHEFGHAVQDAICPGFGQSSQAGAIGEAFGDYMAASYFADKKPKRYRSSVMCWDGINLNYTDAEGKPFDPPCVRRVDEPWTFADFDREESYHENGKIWSAALWEIWNELGRDRADRLILESHFQLDGFTKFRRAARAIIDADENLFAGVHRKTLEAIFAAREIEGF